MINKQSAAKFCLGIFLFGYIFEYIIKEQKPMQHEPVKTQVAYFYYHNPITASGTVSMSAGTIDLIKAI